MRFVAEMSGDGACAAAPRGGFRRRLAGRRVAALASLAALAALVPAPAATAALSPGTPEAVAPGVPGQGRAWELMTPADPIQGHLSSLVAVAPSGDRLAYSTFGPIPGASTGKPLNTTAVAIRGSAGWANFPLDIPEPKSAELGLDSAAEAFDHDLTSVLALNALPLQPGQTGKQRGLYRGGVPGAAALVGSLGIEGDFITASADLSHAVFISEEHLLPADASRTEGRSVYEYAGSQLRLVDVDSGGALISPCGAETGKPGSISADGRRIFFTARPGCLWASRVYMRRDGAATTEISASQCSLPDCGPEEPVNFLGATPDGSSAFLASAQRLTDADNQSLYSLYRYDVASGELKLLSAPSPGESIWVSNAAVEPAEDGSRVYFRASLPACSSCVFVAGEDGVRTIALSAESFMQASADGRYLLFASDEKLDPADLDSSVDVYRYDAESDDAELISAGVAGAGNLEIAARIAPGAPASPVVTQPFRRFSADGSRAFFSTEERLLPEDGNEALDVYEWSGGDLSLVSAGRGHVAAVFLGASRDGSTAFFWTPLTLVPRDRDGGDRDIYAARIGGGFAEPGVAPPGCQVPCAAPGGARAPQPAAATPPRRIRIAPLGPAERRRAAASGRLELLAEVPEGGRLSARARARVGDRQRLVAAAMTGVGEAGPVRLELRLSRAARRQLREGGRLAVRLVLRLSGLEAASRARFALEGER